jgi:hypothetical protein
MKIKTSKATAKFQPVTVSFTLESQNELDKMGSFFNVLSINDVLHSLMHINTLYYQHFEKHGADVHKYVTAVANIIDNHKSRKH